MNEHEFLSNLIITEICAFNRVNFPESTQHERKQREHCALAFKTNGKTAYKANGKTIYSDPTHIVFLPRGSDYIWSCLKAGECLMAEFDCAPPFPQEILAVSVKNADEFSTGFSRMENLMTFRGPGWRAKCMAGLYGLLARFAERESGDYRLLSKGSKICPSVSYLEEHFADPSLSNPALAALSGISTVYFRKVFTEIYGTSPMQYVNRIRIEKAKGLLIGDYVSVSQISETVGFGSVYHFCKAFKKATGLTPTEFRRSGERFHSEPQPHMI